MIKISVIIPAKSRAELLERAIESVIVQEGSNHVEIIVIDDCSNSPLSPQNLRQQDKLIRLDKESGAAVARNVGIDAAIGDVICFLDSDDYFINKDFDSDYEKCMKSDCLLYSEIESQDYKSNFPNIVDLENFFDFILFKKKYICQTSSLCLRKNLSLRFDERLPKHQDWDFVLNALLRGVVVQKGKGSVFFDRSDKNSLSRAYVHEKSKPWFLKLSKLNKKLPVDLTQVYYHMTASYQDILGWRLFIMNSISLLLRRKTSLLIVITHLVRRVGVFK